MVGVTNVCCLPFLWVVVIGYGLFFVRGGAFSVDLRNVGTYASWEGVSQCARFWRIERVGGFTRDAIY